VAQKIILDCDPGIDDALAIAFAAGCPDLDLLGITTVAGNVGLPLTTANAQRVAEFVGIGDTPVTPGAAAPLLRDPIDARLIHGDSGLGGAQLPDPVSRPAGGHAIDYLIDTIQAAPGEITLVATGPLTNIALAVHREPRLVTQVRDFVIMGGSASRGNVTPAAEFNIAADPEAAAITFHAGWTVTMVGLDVTLQARATAAVRDRMRPLGTLASQLLLPALERYASDADPLAAAASGASGAAGAAGASEADGAGPAVHDVLAVAHVTAPTLLGLVPARVEVETAGRWTAGMTVTDFRAAEDERNALVATAIDVRGFWDLVLESYGRVSRRLS
jgi:purine nucleosidase